VHCSSTAHPHILWAPIERRMTPRRKVPSTSLLSYFHCQQTMPGQLHLRLFLFPWNLLLYLPPTSVSTSIYMYTHVCGSIRRLFANFKGFVGSAVSVPLRFLLSHSLMQNLNLHGKQLEGFFKTFC